MSRAFLEFPVLAVSAIIYNRQSQLLLIRRANPPAKNLWAFPGGVVQLGESPDEAILREVQEECGLGIKIVNMNHYDSHIFKHPDGRIEYHYIIMIFLCDPLNEHITVGGDVLDGRWFDLGAIEKLELAPGILNAINEMPLRR